MHVAMNTKACLSLIIVGYCAGCATSGHDAGARYATVRPTVCEPAASPAVEDTGVLLEWTPPTHNTDGSTLIDLAAYRIDWGQSEGNSNECVWIDDPNQTSYLFSDLSAGSYKFVVVAVNAAGVTSAPSGALHKSIR